MADIEITVDGGTQKRLLTAGKYCDKNILVSATGGGGGTEISDTILNKTIVEYSSSSLTSLANNALERCSKLERIILPNCTSVGENVFLSCTALTFCYFPSVKVFAYGSFSSCTSLRILKLESVTTINRGRTFQSSGLESLIISNTQVIPSVSGDAFANTPIESGTGFIYVPDDLLSQYKAATNWTKYASQIKGISEIPADVQEWLDQQEGFV